MGGRKDVWNDISKKLWGKLELIFQFEHLKIEKNLNLRNSKKSTMSPSWEILRTQKGFDVIDQNEKKKNSKQQESENRWINCRYFISLAMNVI